MPGLAVETSREVAGVVVAWELELDDYPTCFGWSPDGARLAVGTAAGTLTLARASDGGVVASRPGHAGGVLCLAFSPDSCHLASGGQDGRARLWEAAHGEPEGAVEAGGGWVEHLAWAPSWGAFATAAGRHLRLWQSPATLRQELPPAASTLSGLAFRPRSGELAAISYGATRFWRLGENQPIRSLEWKTSLLSLAFSPNGRHLACGCQDSAAHVWEVDSAKDLEMSGYPRKVRELSWSADSRLLATGGGPAITVWDFSGKGPAGAKPLVLAGHSEDLVGIAFQHQGQFLASACQDGGTLIWHPGKLSEPLAGGFRVDDPTTGLAWSPDDRLLAVGYSSGRIVVLDRPGRRLPNS